MTKPIYQFYLTMFSWRKFYLSRTHIIKPWNRQQIKNHRVPSDTPLFPPAHQIALQSEFNWIRFHQTYSQLFEQKNWKTSSTLQTKQLRWTPLVSFSPWEKNFHKTLTYYRSPAVKKINRPFPRGKSFLILVQCAKIMPAWED